MTAPALASEPPRAAAEASERIVSAMVAGDYRAFVAGGEPAFAGLPEAAFRKVVDQLAPRLKGGCEVRYLGELRKQGYEITLWRFRFEDGGDDLLGTLSMRDGKVGGYWIK